METKITILKDGKTVECDVLFRVNDEKKNLEYVVYTDNTKDFNGDVNIYVSSYSDDGKLLKVNSDDEMRKINKIIKVIQEEVLNNEN